MDAKKYFKIYIILTLLVVMVAGTAEDLLDKTSELNTTFAETALGSLFSQSIIGVILVLFIFIAIYFILWGKKNI